MPGLDLPRSGKGLAIAAFVLLAAIIGLYATTLTAIVLGIVLVGAAIYLLWAAAVRLNRRLTGRALRGGGS